jgi:hypothetical protein
VYACLCSTRLALRRTLHRPASASRGNRGPEGEIPATSEAVEFAVGVFADVNEDGRIRDERRYYDVASTLGQLGLVGEPA